jgi:ribosomal peptide maturation radical SAM protein 1
MEFRSKSPTRFYDEIIDYVERYRILDMYVVDNIMDMGYLKTLLPRLIDSGYDLRLQYEIKANLRKEQVATMAHAGLVHVQPGIENLSSRVLKIMDKGVTGCQNVRLLRDAESLGVSLAWNYLYGFPEETDEDYDSIVRQMPALHHLQPAAGSVRLVVERFSPYFDRPELGFGELEPDDQYGIIYDLPSSELRDLAYMFASKPQGIGDETAARLDAAIMRWRRIHAVSRLTHRDNGDHILLVSDRAAFDWRVLRLADPVELAAFRLLDQPHSLDSLARKLPEQAGREVSEGEVAALIGRWQELGLLFEESGQYIHVAPEAENQPLLRFYHQRTLAALDAERRTPAGQPA